MNKEQLTTILDLHEKWLRDIPEGRRANLQEANLRRANLYEANLRRANLWGEIIDKAPLQITNLGHFITITKLHINIGCKLYKSEEWFAFSDEEIQAMDSGTKAIDWWKQNKDFIKMCWQKHCE